MIKNLVSLKFALFSMSLLLTVSLTVCLKATAGTDSETVTSTPAVSGKEKRAREFMEKGNAFAGKGFMDKAHEYWKIALELDPNLALNNENLNPAINMDLSGTAKNFRTADGEKLRNLSDLLSKARQAYDRKEYETALEDLGRAEAISPMEGPVSALREKIILENFTPNPDRPYNNLVKNDFEEAAENYRNGHYDLASQSVDEAIKMDPENSQVEELKNLIEKKNENVFLDKELTRAREQWQEENEDMALEIISGILEKNPSFSAALDLKKKILKSEKNMETDRLRSILSQAQTNEKSGHYNDAENTIKALEQAILSGKKEDSKSYLEKVEKLSPKNPKLGYWKKKVAELSENETSEDPEADVDDIYNLGLQSYRNGDLKSAKKFWTKALELNPQYTQAKRNLDRLIKEHPELEMP